MNLRFLAVRRISGPLQTVSEKFGLLEKILYRLSADDPRLLPCIPSNLRLSSPLESRKVKEGVSMSDTSGTFEEAFRFSFED